MKKDENLKNLGKIHCAGCEKIICYFSEDLNIDENTELELYCEECAIKLKVKK